MSSAEPVKRKADGITPSAGGGFGNSGNNGGIGGGDDDSKVDGAGHDPKRARLALVSVDGHSSALVKATKARTSRLTAPIMLLTGHEAVVHTVKFDKTGEHLASGSTDRKILLWNVYGDCETYGVLSGHKNAVLEVAWGSDARLLGSASADKSVCIWDASTLKRVRRFDHHRAIVNTIAAAVHDPESFVSGGDDGNVHSWDARLRAPAFSLKHNYQITAVAMSQNGQQIYSGSVDNVVQVWDVRKMSAMSVLAGHVDTITCLRVSPDGNYLLSNSMDHTLRAWDLRPFCPGERCIRLFEGANHAFEKLLLKCAWSPDGERVAAGSADRTVFVWDFATSRVEYRLPGHAGSVNEVDFHPKEPILASGSSDKHIYLGELASQFSPPMAH